MWNYKIGLNNWVYKNKKSTKNIFYKNTKGRNLKNCTHDG